MDWLPVLLYVTVIITVSSQPNLQVPLQFTNADKLFHAAEYFGLGVLLARALRRSLPTRRVVVAAIAALAIGVLVGASDEFYQSFVPGRDSSVYDLLADTMGCAVAQFAFLWFAGERA
ncbi:MAG TPA: VanZ family protein [Candidatus Eisenbacteria bacterium]|nr:VanZ family protein [Candidatus Eisenbacteria bacterium]